jgi:hypothetical protein
LQAQPEAVEACTRPLPTPPEALEASMTPPGKVGSPAFSGEQFIHMNDLQIGTGRRCCAMASMLPGVRGAGAPASMLPGVVLLDRHIEKNGGTSFREVLKSAEAAGHCMYWGFSQKSPAWRAMIAGLRSLRPEAPAPRICIEAHSYIDFGGYKWLERLSHLQSLRAGLAARSPPVQLLLNVRLRKPLTYYISFFTWGVAARQARMKDAAARFNFTEWLAATPNLQAEILLSSAFSNTALYGRLGDSERLEWLARWSGDDANSTARAAAAWSSLAGYDVVGITERYDECVALTRPLLLRVATPMLSMLSS